MKIVRARIYLVRIGRLHPVLVEFVRARRSACLVWELLGGKLRDDVRAYCNGWSFDAVTPADYAPPPRSRISAPARCRRRRRCRSTPASPIS